MSWGKVAKVLSMSLFPFILCYTEVEVIQQDDQR